MPQCTGSMRSTSFNVVVVVVTFKKSQSAADMRDRELDSVTEQSNFRLHLVHLVNCVNRLFSRILIVAVRVFFLFFSIYVCTALVKIITPLLGNSNATIRTIDMPRPRRTQAYIYLFVRSHVLRSGWYLKVCI